MMFDMLRNESIPCVGAAFFRREKLKPHLPLFKGVTYCSSPVASLLLLFVIFSVPVETPVKSPNPIPFFHPTYGLLLSPPLSSFRTDDRIDAQNYLMDEIEREEESMPLSDLFRKWVKDGTVKTRSSLEEASLSRTFPLEMSHTEVIEEENQGEDQEVQGPTSEFHEERFSFESHKREEPEPEIQAEQINFDGHFMKEDSEKEIFGVFTEETNAPEEQTPKSTAEPSRGEPSKSKRKKRNIPKKQAPEKEPVSSLGELLSFFEVALETSKLAQQIIEQEEQQLEQERCETHKVQLHIIRGITEILKSGTFKFENQQPPPPADP